MAITISGTTGIAGVDGSAGTPAVQGTDTNTGVFYPAADTVGVSTGGSERLRVDSSGNVGIGTSSPGAKLDVRGSSSFLINATNPTAWVSVDSALTTGSIYNQWNTSSNVGISGTYTNHPYTFVTNNTERMRLDTSGNLQFNSGYGSVATAYGCRAWVNFNGTANTNLSGTYSQSGTTVTVTATAHGLIAGNVVYSDITTGTAVDGTYTVATVTNANTFTYTAGTSLTTSGNITLRRNTIRESGNVSSITDNGVGDYTVNFTTAMPDANYAASIAAGDAGVNTAKQMFGTYSLTTASLSFVSTNYQNTSQDKDTYLVAIFR